ncbi:MAG: CoA transferase subunit A [Hyphomicrobiaceae bacterium]
MAIDKHVQSAAEALSGIRNGASVLISGFGGAGFPNTLIKALREAGPRELTLIVNSATHKYAFTGDLIEAGMVRKVVCSAARGHAPGLSKFEELWSQGRIELECLPQGTFAEAIRAGGAGIPAFYTPVGVGTELTRDKEVRVFEGREHVLEKALKGDVALLRADRADRYGNLSFRYSQANFGPAMATAAALSVAEVNQFSAEPMSHLEIDLPGVFIDRVLQCPMVWPEGAQ